MDKIVAGRQALVALRVSGHILGQAAIILAKVAAYAIVIAYALSSVGAFVWMFYSSVKADDDMYLGAWNLPTVWHFDYYLEAWDRIHFGQYFFNSVWIAVASVAGQVLISALAAYALARITTRWNMVILYFFLIAFMLPGLMTLVPTYWIVRSLGLAGGPLAVIVLAWGSVSWNIFILMGFFKTLPSELEEAAAMDGSSLWSTIWRVMMPLAQPGILTVATFNFIGSWNDWLHPLIYIWDEKWYTVALGLLNLRGGLHYSTFSTHIGITFSAIAIATLPTVIVFLLLQERITEGISLGALKG